jgi:hypothetical protein
MGFEGAGEGVDLVVVGAVGEDLGFVEEVVVPGARDEVRVPD